MSVGFTVNNNNNGYRFTSNLPVFRSVITNTTTRLTPTNIANCAVGSYLRNRRCVCTLRINKACHVLGGLNSTGRNLSMCNKLQFGCIDGTCDKCVGGVGTSVSPTSPFTTVKAALPVKGILKVTSPKGPTTTLLRGKVRLSYDRSN